MQSTPEAPPHARLTVDLAALADNWRGFARAVAPATCGAAIKADGYGLGAVAAFRALVAAGCRHFYVAHWHEVPPLLPLPPGVTLAVLHGVQPQDMAAALALPALPVLSTPAQVALWRPTGRPAEAMVDTGLNRLGLMPDEAAEVLAGIDLRVLHSHLACGEERGHPLNEAQRRCFAGVAAQVPAAAHALASTGGITLGKAFHFSHVRPGLGLFGGGEGVADGHPARVAWLSARVLQVRAVPAGGTVGYGATFTADRDARVAVVALGYADGYPRQLSNLGHALAGGVACPAAGRVSMDLAAFDVTHADVAEGDWLDIDFDVREAARLTGRSQYELLTGLGARYARTYR